MVPATSPAHRLGAWPPVPSPLFAKFSHGCTHDPRPTSLRLSSQRPASAGSGPLPGLGTYVGQGQQKYEAQMKEKQVKALRRKARQLGLEVIEKPSAGSGSAGGPGAGGG